MNKSKVNDPRSWKKWRDSGAVSGIIQSPSRLAEGNRKLEEVLTHELVHEVIDEAVKNWTPCGFFKKPNPWVKTVLLSYAKAIAEKVFNGHTPYPDLSSPDWKLDVSNNVYHLLGVKNGFIRKEQAPIIANKLAHTFDDAEEELVNGMWGYSLSKIANVVGCVAYMVNCSIEPDLLKMSDEEAYESLLKDTIMLSKNGPVSIVAI